MTLKNACPTTLEEVSFTFLRHAFILRNKKQIRTFIYAL